MKAYRFSTKIKLGLVLFAVAIALASLAYTHSIVQKLRAREQAIVRLWADAQAEVAQAYQKQVNPYQADFAALARDLRSGDLPVAPQERDRLLQALSWAEGMPPSEELSFITNNIIIPNPFGIPAIITDSAANRPIFWRDVSVAPPDTLAMLTERDSIRAMRRLERLRREMDETYAPIPITLSFGPDTAGGRLVQYVHYDESTLIETLRLFPYVQLLFVSLFIVVGYLGFSYIRRSEQSSLWVGMAKEAAHQLGTPISSLMGWTEYLRIPELEQEQETEALDEIDKDIERLKRVANRFSDIGSMPKLQVQPLAPLVEMTTDYMRRRIPSQSGRVVLETEVPGGLRAPLNAELFEWVLENLLKNALDAMERQEGRIHVSARRIEDELFIEVEDDGRGIDRRDQKNIFRPGYSTKKRGWGLGLSLAKRIVEEYHGGELTLVQSKPGEGSTFRITLPAADRPSA